MSKRILEIAAAVLLTLAAIASSVATAWAGDIVVSGAFARASASPLAKSGAIYMTIANSGAEADRLIAVATPAAHDASLHESVMADGMMKMEDRPALDIPTGSQTVLKPGGFHIMLMGLSAPLKEGESFALTLTFEKAGIIALTVPVAGVAADQAPGG